METISIILLVVTAALFLFFANRTRTPQPSWLFERGKSEGLGTAFLTAVATVLVFTFIVPLWLVLFAAAVAYGYYAYRNYRAA